MKKLLLTCTVALLLTVTAQAQVVRKKIGNNPTTINNSAALEVESTNRGFLPPRVALTGTQSPAPLAAHVQGMIVFNTATTGNVTPGLYINDGTKWQPISGASAVQSAVSVTCDGFAGNWTKGSTGRTFKVTFTNNSFSAASVTPVVGDLVLSPASGLTVASVSPNTNTAIPAGGGQLVVTYTLGGTLNADPGTEITGTYTKVGLSCTSDVTVANLAPVASAGSAQNAIINTTVTLAGSATDSDGSITSYAWSKTGGTGAATPVITSPSSASTTVTGLSALGTYIFTLTVTDNLGATHQASVTITVVEFYSTGLGSTFTSPPQTPYSNTQSFSENNNCAGSIISSTRCASVSGATLNDNSSTALGKEYNWSGNSSSTYMQNGATQALVEINGQCWYRRNANNGDGSYYNNTQYTNEGKLYGWSQAMGNSTTSRAQGICPSGWHIPSDCEWMYLMHSMGASVANQQGSSINTTGIASSLVATGTNTSGFSILLGGGYFMNNPPYYGSRGDSGYYYSSTSSMVLRSFTTSQTSRGATQNIGSNVRCLKD